MAHLTLLPNPELVRVEQLIPEPHSLTMVVSACRPTSLCPVCEHPAERVHSHYQRTLAEQPWKGFPVRLQLQTRRWFCDRVECPRRIFTERLPGLVSRFSRRTGEQARQLTLLAYVLGGEAGSRTAGELGMPISPDTLLRQLRQRGAFQGRAPRVLGVDDFALARGQRYGTILVDLERGEVIDLLPDRTAKTLETWLQEHPGAEIISRDRGGSYAEGARRGAPAATQVADRFHLLKNLTEALGDLLGREHAALTAAAIPEAEADPPADASSTPTSIAGEEHVTVPAVEADPAANASPVGREEPVTEAPEAQPWERQSQREQQRSVHSRARRMALYQKVVRLHEQGLGASEIARQLGISHTTVHKYLGSHGFPERKKRATAPSKLSSHADYLRQRWEAGVHNTRQLWEELRQRGYSGQRLSLWRFLKPWRDAAKQGQRPTGRGGANSVPASPAPRTVVWWLLCPKKRTEEQSQFVKRLQKQSEVVRLAHQLVQEFIGLVRERKADQLESWVTRAEQSGLPELVSFAHGLHKDWAAVAAGLSLPWSNGPVEGQVNRLKLIKRQMYGRAKITLLRSRVLPGTALS